MKTKVAMMIAVIALAGGVQAQAKELINLRADQVVSPISMNTINFVDHGLNSWLRNTNTVNISVDSAGMSSLYSGYQEAWAVFRNHTEYEYVIEVRSQFYDSEGVMLPDITKWQRVFVPANSLARYAQASIDDRTSYFRMEARSAK